MNSAAQQNRQGVRKYTQNQFGYIEEDSVLHKKLICHSQKSRAYFIRARPHNIILKLQFDLSSVSFVMFHG